MKKQITRIALAIVLTLFLFRPEVNAQAFKEGSSAISVGYGFPYLLGSLFNAYSSEDGYSKATTVGPLYFKYEYGVTEHIGIGLNIAYVSTGFSYTDQEYDNNGNLQNYTDKLTYSSLSVLARANYHFATSEKFDPYVGVGLGYRNGSFSWSSTDPNFNSSAESLSIPEPLGFELTVGAHYYFTDNIGVFAEVGFAKSPIEIGLTGKFGGK